MNIRVGDGIVTPEVAAAEASQRSPEWPARVVAAFGGAVIVVCLMVLAAGWSTGLRPSTFETLRADISSGSVMEWYAASSLDKGAMDFARAEQAGESGGSDGFLEDDSGTFVPPEGFPDGGLIVWRSWGETGWSVAGPGGAVAAVTSAGATEESVALVRQLRAAQVPMKPFEFTDSSTLDWVYGAGALLVLARLALGPATRLGTKWFWLWLLVGTPLALGAIAYAVTELVGLRRRPDPPANKRFKGLWGFVAAILISLAVGAASHFLRSRGVPLPL